MLELFWDFQANTESPSKKIPCQKKSYSHTALQQLTKKLGHIRKGRFVTQKYFTIGLNYYHMILQQNSVCCLPKHSHHGSANISQVLGWSNEWNNCMFSGHQYIFHLLQWEGVSSFISITFILLIIFLDHVTTLKQLYQQLRQLQ